MIYKSLFQKLMYTLGYSYRYNKWKKVYYPRVKENYAGKKIWNDYEANLLIKEKVGNKAPLLVARIGSTELSVIYNYLLYNKRDVKWDSQVVQQIQSHSGFFPVNEKNLRCFAEIYLKSISCVDLMGVWFNEGEEKVCQQFCPNAEYIPLKAIEPYYFQDPWSSNLENKTVLVIHPFEKSIQYQFHHWRNELFGSLNVLPNFQLKTIKAVQSLVSNKTEFISWFDALQNMYDRINATEFDIAIIGAGAYGLPLGAFVKSLGKQAIHMGGATQILFGIKGSRWEENSEISKFFNSFWKRPEGFETPANASIVENACYW